MMIKVTMMVNMTSGTINVTKGTVNVTRGQQT